ncbi:heavy-metal-associated domain-containing protein [Caloramator proteoclasticus]|uniref:Copper chaperone CopZ n=1 Tax=Caloramator proteoclasticus DSM 10124 TaxID=1121262 RepID=A0A1M4V5X5_9CLOT|nr:heavy-metal-associated domain-containing protein [Caloramator proteoclasticus]SHE64374.1 Copper chaperone CopZ [Caloramator proteoclasticus DSM 10124]
MKEYSFKVPSMHDETSAKEIASIITGIRGIQDVDVDYQEGTVNVYFDENQVIKDKIKYIVEKKGFKVDD